MMALARQIPEADRSTQAGKWEKSKFLGVELYAKTLGVIGCGNIGSIVADRAIGLKMKVIAFDPFLSPERAMELGVEKVELDELLRRADFITLHTPLTDKTRNIIDAAALKKTKKGVRIVNCARGGLVDERALAAALKSGQVAGAAFDVFEVEPAKESALFGLPNVICTPHLGAATQRGAGERRPAGRRADVGLPAQGRHLQRRQLPQHHRRGGAAAQALGEARRAARPVRRPAHRDQHQGRPHRVFGRGGRRSTPSR